MIGHALLMFTSEEEDRVLTGKLTAGMRLGDQYDGSGCLFQVASGLTRIGSRFSLWSRDREHTVNGEDRLFPYPPRGQFDSLYRIRNQWASRHGSVGHRYDALCTRFGVERIANAIRSRILTNQLRRQLAQQAVSV